MAKELENTNNLTIFTAGEKERQEAIQNLLSGKTPASEVREYPGKGGQQLRYVNTYYMTRQISLVTGFRWTSSCLEERILDNEVGARMQVIIWDAHGNEYSHTSWGQKDIARWANDVVDKAGKVVHKKGEPLSMFDDLKAAYSDGIKKCLSYFGIANDVYGGKEIELFGNDHEASVNDYQTFGKFLKSKRLSVSEAAKLLGVKRVSDITDYKEAHDKILEALEKKNNA